MRCPARSAEPYCFPRYLSSATPYKHEPSKRASRFQLKAQQATAVKVRNLNHKLAGKEVGPLALRHNARHSRSSQSLRSKDTTLDPTQVLRDVNLSVSRGSLHILVGANGCGKSTLLRVLGNLLPQQSGEVHVDGPVGIVLQNPDHQIIMPTVAAEVAFGLGRFKLAEKTVERLVMDALHAVELQDYANRPTNTLSGGQKQRVAIAGALAQNPKMLLLDELTTFLDDEGQQSVMQAVRAAVDGPRKVTAMWVTHRLEELQWADGASLMQSGSIKHTGRPGRILRLMKQT